LALSAQPVTNTVDFLNLDAPRKDIGGGVLTLGEMMRACFGWMPRCPRRSWLKTASLKFQRFCCCKFEIFLARRRYSLVRLIFLLLKVSNWVT
jgi:hypothetical protein